MDNSFLIKRKTQLTRSWSCCDFVTPFLGVENQATSIGTTRSSFPGHSCRPMIHVWLWTSWGNLVAVFLRFWCPPNLRFIGSSFNQVTSNCNTVFLLLWQHKPQNEFCHSAFHAKILHQNPGPSSFGISRSGSISCTVSHQSLLIAACTSSTFSRVLLVADVPECESLSRDFF